METNKRKSTMNLPTFNLGSPKQISAATAIRQDYVDRLLDRGFPETDIQNLVIVRCVAKWWLDNKSKLGVMDAQRHFKAVNNLIKAHDDSAELAAEFVIDAAYKKEKETAEYIYNSTPMFKL